MSGIEPPLSSTVSLTTCSTLSVFATLPSPTTLQVAAFAYSLYNGTRLTQGGCAQEDGSKNCSAACGNMTQVFSSMDTFQNCLAFPTINNILSSVDTTDEYKDLAREYGITGEDTNASFGVVDQISTCLASYCSDSSNCYAPGRTLDQGSDTSCASLQGSNHFPIILSAIPRNISNGLIYCDANAATLYAGEKGTNINYGGDMPNRQAYCNTSFTIDGSSARRARLFHARGALGCISSICNGVLQTATVNADIGGIGV